MGPPPLRELRVKLKGRVSAREADVNRHRKPPERFELRQRHALLGGFPWALAIAKARLLDVEHFTDWPRLTPFVLQVRDE